MAPKAVPVLGDSRIDLRYMLCDPDQLRVDLLRFTCPWIFFFPSKHQQQYCMTHGVSDNSLSTADVEGMWSRKT